MSRISVRMGWIGALLVAAGASVASAEVVDQTVATVDQEVILQSDVMGAIAADLKDLRAQGAGADANDKVNELVKQAVDQAVEEKILIREAKLAGITVEDKDVEKRFQEFRARYNSTEEFIKDLELYGETQSDLRESLRERILATRMASRKMDELSKQVVVSESDVAQYYEDHKDKFSRPERLTLRQIFLPVGAGEDAAVVKGRLEQLKEEIASGGDFAALAKAHSKGPSAEQGGLVQNVAKGDLVEPLEQAAFALQPGQVSDVIQTPEGFHLIKVEERKEAGTMTLEEARAEIEPELRMKAAQERFDKWMNELRKRSNVQIFL